MISTPHQAWCYDFVSEWLRTENDEKLYEISRYVENEMRLTQRLSKLEVEDIVEAECLPCINEIVLLKLMTNISDHIIQPETIRQIVEKRRTKVWYDFMACYYDGLYQVALMQAFFDEHAAGFHTVDPVKLWDEYTGDYYRMDQYYRQYHICFQKSLKKSNPLLDDLFKQVTDRVEGLYSVWYLGNLSSNWTTIVADSLKENGTIDQISRQSYFYSQRVHPADTRVFVIISDALRYEVADV